MTALAAALARVGVGSAEEAAIRAGREGKAYAAEVRRGLAKALPPALVHPLTAVRSLTREFDDEMDVKIPVTRAAVARIAACEGFDADAVRAMREWFVVDDRLAVEALAAVEVAGHPVLKAVVRTHLDTILFGLLEQLDDKSDHSAPFEFIVNRIVTTGAASKATKRLSGVRPTTCLLYTSDAADD